MVHVHLSGCLLSNKSSDTHTSSCVQLSILTQNKPIEEIATIASAISGNDFRENLPFFTDGLLAISSEERMTTFLRNKVSSDYQRRMSFATQTRQSKNKVQDYVNQISGDWNEGSVANKSSHKRNEARRRRASLDTLPADSFIEIKFIDSTCNNHEMKLRYGVGMGLKSLFKKYAEDRQLSLRQLRFTYEGRTLFLSSVGQKTPQDLNMKHLDSIMVIDSLAAAAALESEDSATSSSDESKENSKPTKSSRGNTKGGKKGHRKCQRRASWAGPEAIIGEEELLKLKHSRQLSRVFTEVAPQFELIRQQLNALNLVCTPPKVKRNRKKIPVSISPLPLVANPNDVGVGGKAGTPFYAVHVGEPDNLYNTTKNRRSLQQVQGQKSISIDLHGMTKEEALLELDDKLPGWIDIAMRGSYPWVIPAVIICGGGNQILSEAVDKWIKGNENVAKAPKKKFGRRRASV